MDITEYIINNNTVYIAFHILSFKRSFNFFKEFHRHKSSSSRNNKLNGKALVSFITDSLQINIFWIDVTAEENVTIVSHSIANKNLNTN